MNLEWCCLSPCTYHKVSVRLEYERTCFFPRTHVPHVYDLFGSHPCTLKAALQQQCSKTLACAAVLESCIIDSSWPLQIGQELPGIGSQMCNALGSRSLWTHDSKQQQLFAFLRPPPKRMYRKNIILLCLSSVYPFFAEKDTIGALGFLGNLIISREGSSRANLLCPRFW